ncbi:MAG: metallophosphoesterase [bacterium]|nr:metallophosphoesterase [bacterium]
MNIFRLAVLACASFFIFAVFGCSALRTTRSAYVIEKDVTIPPEKASLYPDVAIVMIGDIQCRDKQECKNLDPAVDNVNEVVGMYPESRYFLIVAGDLTQSAEDWQIEDYFKKENRIRVDKKDIIRIAGNHDVKAGLRQAYKIIGSDKLYDKREIGNVVLISLSNWHEDAPRDNQLQKYIPDDGLAFLERESKKALAEGKILFILAHEKPEGAAWMGDPRSIFFWRKHNPSNVYNSKELKRVLGELSEYAKGSNGMRIVYMYGHTHAPGDWPDTVTVNDGILYLNTSAIRTTDYFLDLRKYPKIFPKFFRKVFPWNKYSTARVLLLKGGADTAFLFTRNLSKDEWYDFFYVIQLGVPFEYK